MNETINDIIEESAEAEIENAEETVIPESVPSDDGQYPKEADNNEESEVSKDNTEKIGGT